MINALNKINNGVVGSVISAHKNGLLFKASEQLMDFYNSRTRPMLDILYSEFFSDKQKRIPINYYLVGTGLELKNFNVTNFKVTFNLIHSSTKEEIQAVKDI